MEIGDTTWQLCLYPPKIHLLTAEEKILLEKTKDRQDSTENPLPALFQYVDAMKPMFTRDLTTGINGSMGYTVEDIEDFEEMVTKNALERWVWHWKWFRKWCWLDGAHQSKAYSPSVNMNLKHYFGDRYNLS